MKVDRSIGTGPRRSIELTVTDIMDFVADVLRDRSYPDVEKVRSGFRRILPLLRFLFTTRGLGEPAVTVAMPDLEIDIRVSYDPAFEEDMTPPGLALLGRLEASDAITISVRSASDVVQPLRDLLSAASTPGIRFELARVADPAPEPDAWSDAYVSDAVPSDAVPSDAVPSDAVPSDAVPSDTRAADTKPLDTGPSDALPSDTDAAPYDGESAAAARPDSAAWHDADDEPGMPARQ